MTTAEHQALEIIELAAKWAKNSLLEEEKRQARNRLRVAVQRWEAIVQEAEQGN